jgi:hypothetical protein
MILHGHVWVGARDLIHTCHKFIYEISSRIDCVGGVVPDAGGNLCVETAGGLVGVGLDLRKTCNKCAVN